MAYSDVPFLDFLDDSALSSVLRNYLIPNEIELHFRDVFLQNNIVSAFIISERIAQLVAANLGTDENLGTNAPDYQEFDYDVNSL